MSSHGNISHSNILDCVIIDEKNSLYRELKYNILIHHGSTITAKGALLYPFDHPSKIRPLSDEERAFCRSKGIQEEKKENCETCKQGSDNSEIYSPKCGHKTHYHCAFESLHKADKLRTLYRYSSKGKLYFEKLGNYTCPICNEDSLIYSKEKVNPDSFKALIKIVLPKNLTHSAFDEIWIQKPSEILKFKDPSSTHPQFVSPSSIIDKLFKESGSEPPRFHLIQGGLVSGSKCTCTSSELEHMTLDDFYKMMYFPHSFWNWK